MILQRRPAVLSWNIAILVIGIAFGALLQRSHIPGRIYSNLFLSTPKPTPMPTAPVGNHPGLSGDETVKRAEVDQTLLKSKKVMVILAFGQSNSANHGDSRYQSGGMVFNYYLGKLYHGHDPLLGATGDGGSVWTRLGDLLVRAKMCDAVVIASIGVGSSDIQRWSPGGGLHPILIYTLRDLRNHGLSTPYLTWVQGESDHYTSVEQYKARFHRMLSSIRQVEPSAPVFVSITSRTIEGVSPNVQDAQSQLVDRVNHVYLGPNTDSLDDDLRNSVDHTHLSESGLQKYADLWLAALRASELKP